MKKILKFAFAVVAMACVVFASASCGKDDEEEKEELFFYEEDRLPDELLNDPAFKKSKIAEITQGYIFDVKWTKAHYLDTTKFEYQFCLLDSLGNTIKSFPKQTDTVFHWTEEYGCLTKMKSYIFAVYTNFWFKGEKRICSKKNVKFCDKFHKPYYKREENNFVGFLLSDNTCVFDSISISKCFLDNNEEVVNEFNKCIFYLKDEDGAFYCHNAGEKEEIKQNIYILSWNVGIPKEWEGYYYIKIYYDGKIIFDELGKNKK